MASYKTQEKRKSFLRARYSSILAGGSAGIDRSELGIQISNLESCNDDEENSQESREDVG